MATENRITITTTATETDALARLTTRLDQLHALTETMAADLMADGLRERLVWLARDLAGDALRDAHELGTAVAR